MISETGTLALHANEEKHSPPQDDLSRTNLWQGVLILHLLVWLSFFTGCHSRTKDLEGKTFRPINEAAAVFWDRQTTESAELLRSLVDEFNQQWNGLPIKIERSGNYADIFRKVTAGIHAGLLPALAVSYESMTMEYIPLGAVCNLDAWINHPVYGFKEEELNDFYLNILSTNRFEKYGNSFYSFPFAKSLLILYFNKKVLTEAGIPAPPTTWEEFIEQCRTIKGKTGRYAHAVHADCSTVNGIIFSMGGEVVRQNETLYNSQEALAVFRIYETLTREKLAYLISPNTYEDNVAFAKDEIAFVLRSSSGLSDMLTLMEGDSERWGVAPIPQANPEKPATVLYGPNVCIFNTNEAQKAAAWSFIKYFTEPTISVRWSLETGYLPVRKSALEHPDMKKHWEQWPYNKVPYDCLPFAKPEPNLAGWQHVRDLVARVVTEIMTGGLSAENAALRLKREADAALNRAMLQ